MARSKRERGRSRHGRITTLRATAGRGNGPAMTSNGLDSKPTRPAVPTAGTVRRRTRPGPNGNRSGRTNAPPSTPPTAGWRRSSGSSAASKTEYNCSVTSRQASIGWHSVGLSSSSAFFRSGGGELLHAFRSERRTEFHEGHNRAAVNDRGSTTANRQCEFACRSIVDSSVSDLRRDL